MSEVKGNITNTNASGQKMPLLGKEHFWALIAIAHRFNADRYYFEAHDCTCRDEEIGSWKVTIERITKGEKDEQ